MLRITTSQSGGVTAARILAMPVAAFLFGVVLLLSGCVDETSNSSAYATPAEMNTLPVVTIAATDGQAVSEALEEDGPTIVHIGETQFKTDFAERYLTWFVLVNPLDVSITYHGYRMDSWQTRPPVGEISPFYAVQVKTGDEGQWQDASFGRCGTGVDRMVVKPGHAGRFLAYLPLDESDSKVSFSCSWTENGTTVSEVICSPIIAAN